MIDEFGDIVVTGADYIYVANNSAIDASITVVIAVVGIVVYLVSIDFKSSSTFTVIVDTITINLMWFLTITCM